MNIGVELSTTNDRIREAVRGAFERFAFYYRLIIDGLRAEGVLTQMGSEEQLATDLQNNMNAWLHRN